MYTVSVIVTSTLLSLSALETELGMPASTGWSLGEVHPRHGRPRPFTLGKRYLTQEAGAGAVLDTISAERHLWSTHFPAALRSLNTRATLGGESDDCAEDNGSS